MDPLDSQQLGQFWPWGALIALTDCGPCTVGHAKDQKDPKHQKGPKGPLNKIPTKMAKKYSRGSKMAKKSIFRPNFKDKGDKPPPWMITKVKQVEKGPRGPTG
ncbi:hypothetical protein O181_024796 [Austropuccinia psidii MF-1]|uniref:Uncharacterized protein n=1 Tax=Austropuccinia psidii MF-1 TaxID=1389203 RepID=A0A9Q3GYY3_9BASI|nr:hypothetical protein [Austropuccinia psidii MF-1]